MSTFKIELYHDTLNKPGLKYINILKRLLYITLGVKGQLCFVYGAEGGQKKV